MSTVPLADVKAHLNITGTNDDTELQAVIDAAEAAIAKRVGPLAPTSVTVRVDGARAGLALPVTPVVSLTSVTPVNGTALTVGDLYQANGIITYPTGLTFSAPYGYDVVYVAGYSTLPADLVLAVKEMCRHLWRSQRGSGVRRPGSGAPEPTATPTFLFPYVVTSLIEPYDQGPVVA